MTRSHFNEHEDVAKSIEATNISCPDADTLILAVGAEHYAWGDPPDTIVDGYACSFHEDQLEAGEGGRAGGYTCSAGNVTITWSFYSGE